jgi:hypothetical protein
MPPNAKVSRFVGQKIGIYASGSPAAEDARIAPTPTNGKRDRHGHLTY